MNESHVQQIIGSLVFILFFICSIIFKIYLKLRTMRIIVNTRCSVKRDTTAGFAIKYVWESYG